MGTLSSNLESNGKLTGHTDLVLRPTSICAASMADVGF
jgi:hypothetical protein